MTSLLMVTLRNNQTISLSVSDVEALRQIVDASVLGGTLTSLSLDNATRRKMRDLANRGIVNIGTADERDARRKAYSINDWRVKEAVME